MKNTSLLVIAGVVVLAVGFVVFNRPSPNEPVTINNNDKVYCTALGTLSSTQSIQSHRSYCIKTMSDSIYLAQTPEVFKFSVIDDQGNTLKVLDVVHEKIMHFIIVRKDLANFQHVHPEFNSTTGEFTLSNLMLPSDGEYRLFADFTPTASQAGPDGSKLPVTIFQDVQVGSMANYRPEPMGSAEKSKTFGGYQITLVPQSANVTVGNSVGFDFDIKKDGKPVTDLEKYLGAMGHTVVLREGDLQFIHAHATQKPEDVQTGKVHFAISFPEAGAYKLFSQFQHKGKIITSDFVATVIEGTGATPPVGEHGGDSINPLH